MRIAVFCGSKLPENPIYQEEAIHLAHWIATNNHELVYGGANVGIMGILANEVLRLNGTVIGVIPHILTEKEILHPGLSHLHVVADMPSRKQWINDNSDAFIAFPGGCGTMDEIFEVITLNQIDYFNKPVGFVNVNGYYDAIHAFLNTAVDVGFSTKEAIECIHFATTSISLMHKLKL